MKSIIFSISFAFLLSCQNTDSKFYMPAEWEPHEAVWFGWEKDSAYYPSIADIINTITPSVRVKVAVSSDSLLQVAKKYLYGKSVSPANIKFYLMPGDRYWIRDNGASFLVNEKGEMGIADFNWDLYGLPAWLQDKYENNKDSADKYLKLWLDAEVALLDVQMAATENASVFKTNVVHEGGAIEVNGKGTLILCEATVFQRNPNRSREELESEFKRVLGVRKIIWMKKGLAGDPHWFYRRITENYVGGGTGGHTDEFVRFANANTIMLAWVNEDEKNLNPINRMNYLRMNENLKILEQSTDQDGKPFKIIKVPLPDLITRNIIAKPSNDTIQGNLDISPDYFVPAEAPQYGDSLLRVPAASYMNFLITNGLVLLPTYTAMGSSGKKEEEVRKIFEEQFPGRKIVFFNAMVQNWAGGGIHCSTQQQPKRVAK
jgi:agmatine deiminase